MYLSCLRAGVGKLLFEHRRPLPPFLFHHLSILGSRCVSCSSLYFSSVLVLCCCCWMYTLSPFACMGCGAGHRLTCSAELTVQPGLSLKKEAGGRERGSRRPGPAHNASHPNGASHPLGSTILQESVVSLAEQM